MPRRTNLDRLFDRIIDWMFSTIARWRGRPPTPATTPAAAPLFDDDTPPQHPATRAYGYRAVCGLLTDAERDFFHVLHSAVGSEAHVFTKVRVADLLDAADRPSFFRISQKHVDFVICEHHTLRILMTIELDDRSHEQDHRVARDRLLDDAFAEADIPLLRCTCRRHYDVEGVREIVARYL